MALAPAVIRKAEIEIAEHAADRDVPDRPRAGQILALDGREPLMRLAHLTIGPAAPPPVLGTQRLVTAQDQRIENAVGQSLLTQRRPARRSGRGKQLAP